LENNRSVKETRRRRKLRTMKRKRSIYASFIFWCFNFRLLEVSSFFQKVFDLRSDFYLHQKNKWLQTIAITRFVKTDCSFLFVRTYIFDLYPVLCDYWCLQECDGSASVTEFTAGTYFSRIRDTPFATRHHESVPLCENTYRTVAKILDDLLCLYLNYDYYFLL